MEYNKDGMPTLDVYTSGATAYGSYVLLFPSFFHHFPSYQNASAGPWPGMDHDGLMLPEKMAETYYHLATQHRSAWTHELDLRSFSDLAWFNHR